MWPPHRGNPCHAGMGAPASWGFRDLERPCDGPATVTHPPASLRLLRAPPSLASGVIRVTGSLQFLTCTRARMSQLCHLPGQSGDVTLAHLLMFSVSRTPCHLAGLAASHSELFFYNLVRHPDRIYAQSCASWAVGGCPVMWCCHYSTSCM